MSTHHQKTLGLLAETGVRPTAGSSAALEAWAAAESVALPASYLDWARHDPHGRVLARCSNDDHFGWRGLETLPDGRRGLSFHQENQGNFDALCLLDAGEDPPVLARWCGEAWIEACPRFSDYVCAQVFDWQLQIRRDEEDAAIDLFSEIVQLRSVERLDEILAPFEAWPSTEWSVEGRRFRARRVRDARGARVTATLACDGRPVYFGGARGVLEITAADDAGIAAFAAALIERAGAAVAPPIYFSPHHPKDLLRALDRRIADGYASRLRWFSQEPAADAVIERLIAVGRETPFASRETPPLRPDGSTLTRSIGGADWGVRLDLIRVKGAWIAVERIELA